MLWEWFSLAGATKLDYTDGRMDINTRDFRESIKNFIRVETGLDHQMDNDLEFTGTINNGTVR